MVENTEFIEFMGISVSIERTVFEDGSGFEIECTHNRLTLVLRKINGWRKAVLEYDDTDVPYSLFPQAIWKESGEPPIHSDFKRDGNEFWLELAYSLGFNIPVIVGYEPYKPEEGF